MIKKVLFVVSATRSSRDIKIPPCLSAPFVSNDHGRTQKFDFCVSVVKTNFTDDHTPDTINGF